MNDFITMVASPTQAVQEISIWEKDEPIERVFKMLIKELGNRNIAIPFELAIIKDSIFTVKSEKTDTILFA